MVKIYSIAGKTAPEELSSLLYVRAVQCEKNQQSNNAQTVEIILAVQQQLMAYLMSDKEEDFENQHIGKRFLELVCVCVSSNHFF